MFSLKLLQGSGSPRYVAHIYSFPVVVQCCFVVWDLWDPPGLNEDEGRAQPLSAAQSLMEAPRLL